MRCCSRRNRRHSVGVLSTHRRVIGSAHLLISPDLVARRVRRVLREVRAMSEVSSPSLVPAEGFDTDVYVVMEELDHLGRVYRETDEERADRETMIRDLIAGRYGQPVRIVAFNTAQGWCRDVSEEIAREL